MFLFTSEFNKLAMKTLQEYDILQAPLLTLIYGPEGVGKTTLLRLCYSQLKKSPQITYLDAQDFVKRYAYAAQEGNLIDFRKRLRSHSLLIFDHLEGLIGKEKSLEEFLHTYEDLKERGGKMIVGFRGEIPELDVFGEKLSSRLRGGLVLPIYSPSPSELLNYVSRYMRSRYLIAPLEVIKRISLSAKNFSEVHDLIRGFVEYANEKNTALEVDVLEEYLVQYKKLSQSLPTPENIIRLVAELTGVKTEEILGPQRTQKIREARNLAIYAIRTFCGLSYPEIGKYFNKAHSAIIKSCQQFQEQLKSSPWEERWRILLHTFRDTKSTEQFMIT